MEKEGKKKDNTRNDISAMLFPAQTAVPFWRTMFTSMKASTFISKALLGDKSAHMEDKRREEEVLEIYKGEDHISNEHEEDHHEGMEKTKEDPKLTRSYLSFSHPEYEDFHCFI